jgi:hypothetical protein
LSNSAGVSQVMILMQQRVKDRPRFGLPAQLLDLQRLQFAQRARDQISRVPKHRRRGNDGCAA